MPSELITVQHVMETPTRIAGVTRYDIVSRTTFDTIGTTYETTNPWLASVCEQAAKASKTLRIIWKDSRFGKQIVAAEFV